jgi:inhibitor of cysteine peptidase
VKKNICLFIAGFALIGLLAGCASSGMTTYSDPSKTIEAGNGQQFTVVLDGNYTTGYIWEASFDQASLKLVSQDYKANESKQGMLGVPGKASFVFQALKQGSSKITFTYKRPSEINPGDQKVFNVTIK